MSFLLDEIDHLIIECLQQNSWLSNREIGALIHRSASSVYVRVQRLRKNNIIRKSTILIDQERIGLCMVFYLRIKLKEHTFEAVKRFEMAVSSLDEVTSFASITGQYDYLLKVCVPDISSYYLFLQTKVGQISNLSDIYTETILSQIKHSVDYPVSALKFRNKRTGAENVCPQRPV